MHQVSFSEADTDTSAARLAGKFLEQMEMLVPWQLLEALLPEGWAWPPTLPAASDEATSHLDVANESIVNGHIKRLAITRVLVTHRWKRSKLQEGRYALPIWKIASINNKFYSNFSGHKQ